MLDPINATYYNNRGGVYIGIGKLKKAFKDCNKAIELRPNYAEAYYNRGKVHSTKGEIDLALKNYNRAIELEPGYVTAYNNRGLNYVNKGEFDNAIQDYNRAINLQPQAALMVFLYYNRGNAYRGKGKYDQAIKDYTTAIKLQPKFIQAYYNRGEVQLRMEEWEKSELDLIVVKDNGVDIIASFHNDYKNVETFEQRYRVKLPENIVVLLTSQTESNDADTYNTSGIAYSENAEYDRAIAAFNKAIELKSDLVTAYYNRGNAYSKKGELNKANVSLINNRLIF